VKSTGKLASGRSFGSVSIYEYELATGRETPLIESMEAGPEGVRFIADLTAPRYALDGNTLFFCAFNDDTRRRGPVTQRQLVHPVPGWAANCFFFDRQAQGYTLISTDRAGVKLAMENIDFPYAQDKQRRFFSGPGILRFVDPVSYEMQTVLFHPGRGRQLADADLSQQGDTAVAVTGTVMFKNGAHAPKRTFYAMEENPRPDHSKPQTYHREAPTLALIDINSSQVTPLEWTDVSRLNESTKP